MEKECLFLSTEDLSFLVAAQQNDEEVWLPLIPSYEIDSEEAVIKELHKLVSENIIEYNGEGYRMNSEYQKLISGIIYAERTFKITSGLYEANAIYLYVSGEFNIVKIEPSQNRRNAFRISKTNLNELIDDLFERDYLYSTVYSDYSELFIEGEEEELFLDLVKSEEAFQNYADDVEFEMDIAGDGLKPIIRVARHSLDYFIAALSGDSLYSEPYSKSAIAKAIGKVIRGQSL